MLKLLVGALMVVVLAGCSDPEPKEPTPTTSATPTATAPTMPAQAKENTPEGASAFIGYYVKVFNYAFKTGDVAELSRLSDPACVGCQSYIDLFRKTYAEGGYFKNSDWTLGELDVTFAKGRAVIFATVTSPPGEYATDDSAEPTKGKGENADLTFIAERPSNEWRLQTLELQAPS